MPSKANWKNSDERISLTDSTNVPLYIPPYHQWEDLLDNRFHIPMSHCLSSPSSRVCRVLWSLCPDNLHQEKEWCRCVFFFPDVSLTSNFHFILRVTQFVVELFARQVWNGVGEFIVLDQPRCRRHSTDTTDRKIYTERECWLWKGDRSCEDVPIMSSDRRMVLRWRKALVLRPMRVSSLRMVGRKWKFSSWRACSRILLSVVGNARRRKALAWLMYDSDCLRCLSEK